MPAEAVSAGCTDIARQLVEMKFGDGLEVAMGGGRSYFLPEVIRQVTAEGRTSLSNVRRGNEQMVAPCPRGCAAALAHERHLD